MWSLVLLAGCGAGTIGGAALAGVLLPEGRVTATLRIDLTTPGAPKFSGTIAGKPLTGVYSPAGAAVVAKLCPEAGLFQQLGPAAFPAYTYSGTYDGRAYSFSGCEGLKGTGTTLPNGAVGAAGAYFKVQGRIGGDAISGGATWAFTAGSSGCTNEASCVLTFPFSGSIGSQKVTGTAKLSEMSQGGGVLTATLTVG